MGFLKNLPLYRKSDLRYLCMKLIPITSLGTFRYGSCFCPFHYNVNTPAATLFKDTDGIERMYCYSCKRQYTSYDYITLVLEKNPIEYLLKNHTKDELDNILKNKPVIYDNQNTTIEFESIEKLLTEVYNLDLAIPPNQT